MINLYCIIKPQERKSLTRQLSYFSQISMHPLKKTRLNFKHLVLKSFIIFTLSHSIAQSSEGNCILHDRYASVAIWSDSISIERVEIDEKVVFFSRSCFMRQNITDVQATLKYNRKWFHREFNIGNYRSISLETLAIFRKANDNNDDESLEDKRKMMFRPIGLSCPDKNGTGILEIIKKNLNGSLYRGRFHMASRKVNRVTLEMALKNEPFEILKNVELNTSISEEDLGFFENAVETINPIRKVGCDGTPTQKKDYLDFLRSNIIYFKELDASTSTR